MSKGLSFVFGAAVGIAATAAAVYLLYKDKEQRIVYSSTRDFSEEDMDDMSGFRYDVCEGDDAE